MVPPLIVPPLEDVDELLDKEPDELVGQPRGLNRVFGLGQPIETLLVLVLLLLTWPVGRPGALMVEPD